MRNLLRTALWPLSLALLSIAQAQPATTPTSAPASTPTSTSAPTSTPTSAPALPPIQYPSRATVDPAELPVPPVGVVDIYLIFGTGGLRFAPDIEVEAKLFPTDAQSDSDAEETLKVKADSKGLARFIFTKAAPGKLVKAYAKSKGITFESDVVEIPEKTGAANLIGIFETSTNSAQVTLGSGSFMFVSFDEGIMTFLARYSIENRGDTAYSNGKMALSFPVGAFGVQSAPSPYYATIPGGDNQSKLDLDTASKPIMPGKTDLVVQFHMSPPEDDVLKFEMMLPFPAMSFGVQAQNEPKIKDVIVQGMGPATEVNAPKGEVQKFLGTKGAVPNRKVSVEIRGIPYGKGFEYTMIYLSIAAFLAFAIFLFIAVPKNELVDDKKKENPNAAEKERLFRELVALEQGKHQGKVTPERYQKQREEKIKRLVSLSRLHPS